MDFALVVGLLLLFVYTRKGLKNMAQGLGRLQAEVAEMGTVVESAEATIRGLAQEVRDNIGNEAALNALADELDTRAQTLARAIRDVTPPGPGEEPTPTPEPEPAPVEEPTAETSRRGRQA